MRRKTPEPGSIRKTFQHGSDGLTDPPTQDQTYGQMKYADGTGPAAGNRLPNGTGSGLSGLPEANAGTAPPQWAEPDSAPAPSGKRFELEGPGGPEE